MEEKTKLVEIEGLAIEPLVAGAEDGEPVILTRAGRPVLAIVDIRTLEAMRDERDLLRRLALGEMESAAGDGQDLEAVLEDCRLLLEEN